MSYVLKGFATHALAINNLVGKTNIFGEISTQSLTYSREKGFYVSNELTDVTLISFLSAQDDTKCEVPTEIKELSMGILNWVYNKTFSSSTQLFADELLGRLLNQFQTVASSFSCGEIVTDGTNYIPEWVSFTLNAYPGSLIRIWFADASFQEQYDEFEIVVVPPIEPIEYFYRLGNEVETLVKARTMTETMEKVQLARQDFPETTLRALVYDYIDPINTSHKVATNWTILIYGIAGNNVDSIKDALVNYILSNTSHTRAEWTALFPDIFKRTEFIIAPNWSKYAIPNRVIEAGIYSPLISISETIALLKKYAPGYEETHINSYATVTGHPFRSVCLASIGNVENRDSKFKLEDVYPDFIAVSSTSQDFNRMTESTRSFAAFLSEMLYVAENMTLYSEIPYGYTRLQRNGILYLVKSYENIHYLVVAKE